MNITFTAHDLTFEAEIDYTPSSPGRYSGPPEDCYPDDPSEMEFVTLTCDGCDAMFMLASPGLAEPLYEAAIEAADAAYTNDDDDYEE